MHTTKAKFDGHCDANGCKYLAGDDIAYVKGYDKPVCEPCATDVELLYEPGTACRDCWIIHAPGQKDCW